MGDLGKAVGFSTAYVYKFFDSKQAIGEAVCGICLTKIAADLQVIVGSAATASERLKAVFLALSAHARAMAQQTRLQEMVSAAHRQGWGVFKAHNEALRTLIMRIVEDGRRSGEFERETPIDQACTAILLVLQPYRNPTIWAQSPNDLEEQAAALAPLVLRSLMPR
jgi:AcrR family transcriptional regulator